MQQKEEDSDCMDPPWRQRKVRKSSVLGLRFVRGMRRAAGLGGMTSSTFNGVEVGEQG